ncbi:MAG: lytic transglycosylase domain-containing protein [Vampirovibrionales bacterium]|nr:lytic transglycosylase domain-containing protein [Vampirovibrionales bacterium]
MAIFSANSLAYADPTPPSAPVMDAATAASLITAAEHHVSQQAHPVYQQKTAKSTIIVYKTDASDDELEPVALKPVKPTATQVASTVSASKTVSAIAAVSATDPDPTPAADKTPASNGTEIELNGKIITITATSPKAKAQVAAATPAAPAAKLTASINKTVPSNTAKHKALSQFILRYNKAVGQAGALVIADAIIKHSAKHNLDYRTVTGLIAAESGFRPRVVSSSGAVGLGQLKPSTAKTLGVTNLYDPFENLRAATGYLRVLMNRYNGSLQHALAAYLMGPGAVRKGGITSGANAYINRVNKLAGQFGTVLQANGVR